MKLYKFMSVVLCILLSLGCLNSCTPRADSLLPTNTLLLYVLDYDIPIPDGRIYEGISAPMQNALALYRGEYPEVDVQIREIPMGEDPVAGYRAYLDTLRADLAAGKGPDFVLLRIGDFDDLEKTMASGAFFDLNRFLSQDEDFSTEDYIPLLLSLRRKDGTLPLLPLDYNTPVLVTSQEVLKETGLEALAQGISWEEFLQALEQYYANPDARLPLAYPSKWLFFKTMLDAGGVSIIDYENDAVILDTPQFRQLAQSYNQIYILQQAAASMNIAPDYLSIDPLLQGKALFISEVGGGLAVYHCLALSQVGHTPVILPWPQAIESASPGMLEASLFAGIPNASPNKLNAYNFLKIFLGEQMQTPGPSSNNPLRHDFVAQKVDYDASWALNHMLETGQSISLPKEARDELVSGLQELITQASATLGLSSAAWSILRDEMEPYFQGTRTLDEAISQAEGKLNIYIGE